MRSISKWKILSRDCLERLLLKLSNTSAGEWDLLYFYQTSRQSEMNR